MSRINYQRQAAREKTRFDLDKAERERERSVNKVIKLLSSPRLYDNEKYALKHLLECLYGGLTIPHTWR